ncbi:MAG: serine hydrolase domain-containing protein [Woeseiaceae bacterium]
MQKIASVIISFIVIALVASSNLYAQDQKVAAVDWSGLWVAEKDYGPSFRGPVSLQKVEETWLVRSQGETTAAQRIINANGTTEWRFEFPGVGRFVGVQGNEDATIVGHWIQPSGQIAFYPLATPVRMHRDGKDSFIGELKPYLDKVSLNIPLFKEDDAAQTYRTFLRNPERNLGVYFRIGQAVADTSHIRFMHENGNELSAATVIEPGERFLLEFSRTGETLEFTKRDRHEAPGFFPRRYPAPASTMTRPVETDDQWQTTSPTAAGLSQEPLLTMINELAAFEPTALRQPYIHSLLIAHKGKLVVDEYFHGYSRDDTHDSRSSGKSLASALLGIGIHEGIVESIDQPIYPLMGGVNAFANPDPRKTELSFRHLITMSSGLDCDDGDQDSPGNEDVMQTQQAQSDWYRYALDLALIRDPGVAGVYCTAGINLVGGALAKAADMSLMQFFEQKFAQPLSIRHYEMNLSPTEQAYMGGGIQLRPRDFLKLGQLYLDKGEWHGQRLLSEDFVTASAAAQASINDPDDYGYAWWRHRFDVDGRAVETFYASGNGGQMLFVVPELELVVLFQAGNYSDGRTRREYRDRLMQQHILPAAL